MIPEPPELDRVFGFLQALWSVDHGLQSQSKRMEARYGVTGPQRLVLRLIGRFPGISAGRLARHLKLHPSTLTGILQRLEARGRVERLDDQSDKRRALFRLTPGGRELDQLREGTVEAAAIRLFARLPEERIADATQVLLVLAEELVSDAFQAPGG
ncbi:MarR family transcriptional regulator [Myxococcota bacterium]|nr:MarR family transcriptional regulator [Myxococcota bacterium]